MIIRRTLLKGALLAPVAIGAAPLFADTVVRSALVSSNLVYLSPIQRKGLSSCQAEVWYVMLGADIFVCTDASSWRARAPARGVTSTRLWVGDLGVWKRVNYQSLPSTTATASIETDAIVIEQALAQFGRKYSAEWDTWGPRFRRGLADGSRTLLRYKLDA